MRKKSNPLRNRWILISILLLLVASLVWYGYRYNPTITVKMCQDNPLRYDGQEVEIGLEAKVMKLLPDGFLLKQIGRTIQVKGDSLNASPGDFVRLRAVFHKENFMELKNLYVAKGRRLKIVISIAPALLVLYLFFKNFRFDWRQGLFRKKV